MKAFLLSEVSGREAKMQLLWWFVILCLLVARVMGGDTYPSSKRVLPSDQSTTISLEARQAECKKLRPNDKAHNAWVQDVHLQRVIAKTKGLPVPAEPDFCAPTPMKYVMRYKDQSGNTASSFARQSEKQKTTMPRNADEIFSREVRPEDIY